MKKILFAFLSVLILEEAASQTPTLLFTVEKGLEDTNQIVAVPFVMYTSGKYKPIPVCEVGASDGKAVNECNQAKKTILPLVSSGKSLYVLNNGSQNGEISVLKSTEYGVSDWMTYSAILATNPNVSVITNNSSVGLKPQKTIKSKPILKRRKDPEGNKLEDKLLTKVDIDGDNIPELIYLCYDYEGIFYQIFTFKNNNWKKVFEGGYQGL